MADADAEALADAVVAACTENRATAGTDAVVGAALIAAGITRMSLLSSWGMGCLMQPVPQPNDLNNLKALVIAKSGGAIVDTPVADAVILGLVRAARQHGGASSTTAVTTLGTIAAGGAPAAAPDKDKDEREQCASCYTDLATMQNREIELPERATFVAGSRTTLKTFGYLAELPSVGSVKTYGTTGTAKQRFVLQGGAETASFEVGDRRPDHILSVPEAQYRLRILLNGVAAACSTRINKNAYGGRDYGWVNVPGSTSQVRLVCTVEALDKLLWACCKNINTADASIFIRCADRIVLKLLTLFARCQQHLHEIIDVIIETKTHLFDTRTLEPQSDTSSIASSASAMIEANGPAVSAAAPAGAATGVCYNWLTNGSCNATGCTLMHPAGQRGAMHGNGGRSSAARRKRPWGDDASNWAGSQGWEGGGWNQQGWNQQGWNQQAQGWNQQGGKGGKGKGKGKGAKGGKGGKGKGGWW